METLRKTMNVHYPDFYTDFGGKKLPRHVVRYPSDQPQCRLDAMHSYLSEQKNKPFSQLPNAVSASSHSSFNTALESLFYQDLFSYFDFQSLFSFAMTSRRMWNMIAPKLKRPNWAPAFPETEDVPRENGISFSVFYIPDSQSMIHRLTLTRRRPNTTDVFACFIDGELLYLCRHSIENAFCFVLYNDAKWKFKADLEGGRISDLPPFLCSFHIGDQLISIRPHNMYTKFGWEKFTPNSFHVYINGSSTGSHSSLKKERRISEGVCLVQAVVFLPVIMWINPFAQPIIDIVRRKKEKDRDCEVKKRFLPPNANSHKDVGNIDRLAEQSYVNTNEPSPSPPSPVLQKNLSMRHRMKMRLRKS